LKKDTDGFPYCTAYHINTSQSPDKATFCAFLGLEKFQSVKFFELGICETFYIALNVHSLLRTILVSSKRHTWMAFVLLSYGFIYCFNDCLFSAKWEKLHSRFLFSASFYAFLIKRIKQNVLRWITVKVPWKLKTYFTFYSKAMPR
jgi:hypothetical protein